MTGSARAFVGLIVSLGVSVLVFGLMHPAPQIPSRFVVYLIAGLLASQLKVRLPGSVATMSASFFVVLMGAAELNLVEALVLGSATACTQIFEKDRPSPIQVAFNLCVMVLAAAGASLVCHIRLLVGYSVEPSLLLVPAAAVYFALNTVPVAAISALTEGRSLGKTWAADYVWVFPYYLLGAILATPLTWIKDKTNWQLAMLLLPTVYLLYRSYQTYMGRLEAEKGHSDKIAKLHLRTIEALALAIEAKDQTTHDHLQRVRIYATEVAKKLKVSPEEQEALQAASLLHDIGKLAVPEHIVSKPGKLTREEFEKMKIHPMVGAEILERVEFPYPVAPIVRAHHEKWDGSGYPLGLKGDAIPIGARILAAVDFLDAMSSDRQYRRGLPLDDVIKRLFAEAGKSFDPKVVDILMSDYRELEELVRQRAHEGVRAKLSTEIKVERGSAPAAGFEKSKARKVDSDPESFIHSIAAARQEVQVLFEMSQELGASLSLDETLSIFSTKLKRLIPFDSIAIYVEHNKVLVPEHTSGDSSRLFSSLRIPVGEGLSGWVAENIKPILNGNPDVEPGYLNEPGMFTGLGSALAVPLEGAEGVVGVVTLYRSEKDAFGTDDLRVLLAISSKMAAAMENAIKYRKAESSATTDYLTGLPNARSLFLQLDQEIARGARVQGTVTVMVCDLDGFKQLNDRFGHLEGNRALQLFARGVKDICREYDYVARMGGDEFVLITPNLPQDVAVAKQNQLRKIAEEIGQQMGKETLLSASVGCASFPTDASEAAGLLAEADRRMYVEKKDRSGKKNRRLYPRMKCRLGIELYPEGSVVPTLGTVSVVSMSGCFIETPAVLPVASELRVRLSVPGKTLDVNAAVVSNTPGLGLALKFIDLAREGRENLEAILKLAESSNDSDTAGKRYLATLAGR